MSETYSPERRKPGRPTNAEREARQEALQQAQAEELSVDSKRAAETRRERRRRADSSLTSGLKLHVPDEYKEDGFEYRWLNDDGQRIHSKTVLDDYDIVMTSSGVDGQGEGTPVKRLVGKGDAGQPIYAVLARKPKDWYREDKAKEQEAIRRREDDMRRGTAQGPEGLAGPRAYIPEGGIKIGE